MALDIFLLSIESAPRSTLLWKSVKKNTSYGYITVINDLRGTEADNDMLLCLL